MRLTRDPLSRTIPAALAAGMVLSLLIAWPAWATEYRVPAGGEALRDRLVAAQPGDILRLQPGVHSGPLVVSKPLQIIGAEGAVIDGGGNGRVITIASTGVRVSGLTIRDSGASLATEDSAIFVTEEGDGAVIDNNRLERNLIGVYLKGPDNATVRNNIIIGRSDLRVNERGNGVQVWNSPGSVIEGNRIRAGRDGIFVNTSRDNVFRNNRMEDLRFAIHYMYADNSEVSDNLSIGNHIGYALMYSRGLTVRGNESRGDRDRGILLNYTNESEITGNRVSGGPVKCVFIYNANINRIAGNYFEGCEIGVHFTAGSERNRITGNAFVANRNQVKYVGTRHVEWSVDGRGNYWSDNTAFDIDGDGIADRPYQPNDLVDQLMWRYPLAKLLLNSPALQVLRWAQSEFPALRPGGVTDSAPLMAPPAGSSGSG